MQNPGRSWYFRGDVMFHDSSRAEGLGFNLYVAPAGSLGPSIS